MARSVILSNGNLNIGLNNHAMVADFYFPDNGYENHTLGDELVHRIGLMIDGEFSWINDGSWQFEFRYLSDALISETIAVNNQIQVQIELRDAVASGCDVFLRQVKIVNLASFHRNFQLFFYQNFAINSGKHFADTVQFIPERRSILHYRGKRAFVVSAERKDTENNIFQSFSQHTVGLFGIENKLGSWVDCEDGILSGANVEHGQTDSALGFDFGLSSNQEMIFQYTISCADNHDLAFRNSALLSGEGFIKHFEKTQRYWRKWLSPALKVSQKLPEKYRDKFIQSVMLVKSHIASSGAPIASNDSEMLHHARDDYSYCWPRDALYALWPLIRIGYFDEAEKFFEFCLEVKNPAGFMNHKYLPNGELGPSWHPYSQGGDSQNLPIQIDETASIIFLYAQFHSKFHNYSALEKFYPSLIKPMSDFLSNFLSKNSLVKPSYELWEMDFLSTTYSNAIVFAALNSAADLARDFGKPQDSYRWRAAADKIKKAAHQELFNTDLNYFYRGIWPSGEKDSKLDASSFYGAFMFGLFDFSSSEIERSFESLSKYFEAERDIGIPRFENDVYYRFSDDYNSNIWIISTLWQAEFYLAKGYKRQAERILDWVVARSSSTGILPEQINPRNLEWLSVAPLTWSQAEFVSALLDLIYLEE